MAVANDKRADGLLSRVREAAFVLHELVLFLDTHPNDRKAMSMYTMWQKQYETYKAEYEQTYGPLSAFSVRGNKWDWAKAPWPWMGKEDVNNVGV